jgi:hypothetical protein
MLHPLTLAVTLAVSDNGPTVHFSCAVVVCVLRNCFYNKKQEVLAEADAEMFPTMCC